MSKNEPVTKERLEDCAFATLRFPLADSPPDTQPQMVNSVTLDDALAYGDERYEAGLMDAARVLCSICAGKSMVSKQNATTVLDSGNVIWIHRDMGGSQFWQRCTAGPIHDLLHAKEERDATT